jgi:predicted glycosyltransferase
VQHSVPVAAAEAVPTNEMSNSASQRRSSPEEPKSVSGRKRIWIDLDNSPHVLFFRPIIDELKKKNYDVFITARDAYQVRELLEFYGLSAQLIGRHHGKHKILKAIGTCFRGLALAAIVRKEKLDLAITHGSRGCLLACALLRIPDVLLFDYEFVAKVPTIQPSWLMAPDVVVERYNGKHARILQYPGIKEDVYLSRFVPDYGVKQRLGIAPDQLLVTVRPPAKEAHYHNPESDQLLTEAIRKFAGDPLTKILLLPRNKKQEAELRVAWAEDISRGQILIPDHVEDGLNLIWNSDCVISGGGTMNREAAALGVPVYSIFRGQIGAVDRYLADQGRLILLETVDDVRTKIKPVCRITRTERHSEQNSPALETIIGNIVSIIEVKPVAVGRIGLSVSGQN